MVIAVLAVGVVHVSVHEVVDVVAARHGLVPADRQWFAIAAPYA